MRTHARSVPLIASGGHGGNGGKITATVVNDLSVGTYAGHELGRSAGQRRRVSLSVQPA